MFQVELLAAHSQASNWLGDSDTKSIGDNFNITDRNHGQNNKNKTQVDVNRNYP